MKSSMSSLYFISFLLHTTISSLVLAQTQQQTGQTDTGTRPAFVDMSLDGVVSYAAPFFQRYQPNTALDMVRRIPGFTLDDGGDKRGFGGAAGNVLINGRRPSTKQDLPSAILGRISADLIERIELIQVRIRDINLHGQSAVVNVILREDAPAMVRWELFGRHNFDQGPEPGGSISLSDRLGGMEYNIGLDARSPVFGDPGKIQTFDADGVLVEFRRDDNKITGLDLNAYLNSSVWMGDAFFQLNSRVGIADRDSLVVINRFPQIAGVESSQDYIDRLQRNKRLDLGIDAERILHNDLLGKAIFLYSLLDQDPTSSQRSIDAAGSQARLQIQDDDRTSREIISRLELDWAGLTNHAIRLELEFAFNLLDNAQIFTDDIGFGPVVVDVTGGNTRVEEARWNFLAQDTWSLGYFDIEYGLGLEWSTISQSGDSTLERSFTYLKPRTAISYSAQQNHLTRLLFEREVAQLDFNDFVSATVFEDDILALGNPRLQPDNTWISEISHEYRYSDIGAIKLTAFHHWITDVLDLLPLSATNDAPGNIGDGRRWGLILETTLPLDWLRLTDARLDFKARLQDSTVVDPLTGLDRVLSAEGGFTSEVVLFNENRYGVILNYRQDFQVSRISWGWGLGKRGERSQFKANELDVFSEDPDLNAFIETTRWFGFKTRIEGTNMLNSLQKRDRTVYAGERSLSPVQRRELRDGTRGVRVLLSVSGSF
jgi:hypothetical protein